jgi:hypothetical protein
LSPRKANHEIELNYNLPSNVFLHTLISMSFRISLLEVQIFQLKILTLTWLSWMYRCLYQNDQHCPLYIQYPVGTDIYFHCILNVPNSSWKLCVIE